MEEVSLFVLIVFFGSFFLFFMMMLCIRLFVYLRDDKRLLCFKSKAALQRRRIQLSLLPEGFQRVENLGYIAAPDENINEFTICQPYVYEDVRCTGMGMIANLPMAIAFTNHSGIAAESNFNVYPPISSISPPNLSQRLEACETQPVYEELPPPAYNEQPPPTYDECMKSSKHFQIEHEQESA